jgi:AcrR family transcriptional regulator
LRLFSERGFARTTVRDIARQAGITDAAIYYHFESKQELLEALVEERGFVNSLQNLARLQADAPLKETLHWTARGAINIMDENRDFLRLIIMEGLGGDEAALEQYRRLLGLWESALVSVLRRYEEKGELRPDAAETVARHIIYTILMAFEESLLGRHVPAGASAEERRTALESFVAPALDHIVQGLGQDS